MAGIPEDLGPSAGALTCRAMRFLNILPDREEVRPYTWMYEADPGALMTRPEGNFGNRRALPWPTKR